MTHALLTSVRFVCQINQFVGVIFKLPIATWEKNGLWALSKALVEGIFIISFTLQWMGCAPGRLLHLRYSFAEVAGTGTEVGSIPKQTVILWVEVFTGSDQGVLLR